MKRKTANIIEEGFGCAAGMGAAMVASRFLSAVYRNNDGIVTKLVVTCGMLGLSLVASNVAEAGVKGFIRDMEDVGIIKVDDEEEKIYD